MGQCIGIYLINLQIVQWNHHASVRGGLFGIFDKIYVGKEYHYLFCGWDTCFLNIFD